MESKSGVYLELSQLLIMGSSSPVRGIDYEQISHRASYRYAMLCYAILCYVCQSDGSAVWGNPEASGLKANDKARREEREKKNIRHHIH